MWDVSKCNKRFVELYNKYSTGHVWEKPHDERLIVGAEDGKFIQSLWVWNRNEDTKGISQYRDDMESGRWEESHEGFGFDWDGRPLDCYHRSKALSLCSKKVRLRMLFTFGLKPAVFRVVNTGIIRNDQAQIKIGTGEDVTRTDNQVLKFLVLGKRGANECIAKRDLSDVYTRHRDAIQFVKERLKACYKGPIAGAVARAYYHPEFREALTRFCCEYTGPKPVGDYRGGSARARAYFETTHDIGSYLKEKTGFRIPCLSGEIMLPEEFGDRP